MSRAADDAPRRTQDRGQGAAVKPEDILRRLSSLLPADGSELDGEATAYRWSAGPLGGRLAPLKKAGRDRMSDLLGLEEQAEAIRSNTQAFLEGRPANHVLLTGPRGCGKSSLARAVLGEFLGKGLRVIDTDSAGILSLGDIRLLIDSRPEKYAVFCDDLSFSEPREAFRALKAALEGGLSSSSNRLLVYATSNRRHLVPETFRDNLEASRDDDGELQQGESVEEKIALSDRFGLWVPVFAPGEDEYLEIVGHWLRKLKIPWSDERRAEALRWSMEKGVRNGRAARQFATDLAQRSRKTARAGRGDRRRRK